MSSSDYIAKEHKSSGELEQLLSGAQPNSKEQPLLNSHDHKYFTVVPRPSLLWGAYNKINYIAVCYNLCMMTNNEPEPKTRALLCFGGGFSRFGSILAFLLLFMFFVFPFGAVWPFVVEPKTEISRALLTCSTCFEFLFLLWHFFCIYVISQRNVEVWSNSWFTFFVQTEVLEDDENYAKTHSFFYQRGKLLVIDISVTDLFRLNSGLHQLTASERDKLASVVQKHRLEQAVIILYSNEFMSEFITWSVYEILVLAILSAGSTAILSWKTFKIWL